MSSIRIVDFRDYLDIPPGQYRALPGTRDRCIYRRLPRKGHEGDPPSAADFREADCAQAKTWVAMNARNKIASTAAMDIKVAERAQAVMNPQSSSETPMPSDFDPLAELIKEFGPSAQLGEELPSGAPEYDPTYPTSGGRGPYGLSTAPYGARRALPVNRRNPKPASGKQAAARQEFAAVTKMIKQIQAERSDKTGRNCTLKEAWAILKERQAAGATPNPAPSAAKPSSPKQAAARQQFATLAKLAQKFQVERGCSPKEAWALARQRYRGGTTATPNPSPWNAEFARLAQAARDHQKASVDASGKSCSLAEAWLAVYPQAQRTAQGKAWTGMFKELVAKAHAVQKARGCSLDAAWKAVYPESARKAKKNPDDDFEQTPDPDIGGSYLDYVDQDMYGYEAPASPPNEPWDWASQYEYRQGAYGPAAQFPPTNRRNPARRNPDEDYTKWSAMDLVELSNRGDEDASTELARREANREAKTNGRARKNGMARRNR